MGQLGEQYLTVVREMLIVGRAVLGLYRDPDFDPADLANLTARRRAQVAELKRLSELGAAGDMSIEQLLQLRALQDQLLAQQEETEGKRHH